MPALFLFVALSSGLSAQRSLPPTDSAWAPKPSKPPAYQAPHRPHTRLTEVLKAHSGQDSWRHPVVDDAQLMAAYISAAPGTKLTPRFHPETRVWWVVLDGQMRVSIEGAGTFVATKGSIVQVPLQTVYQTEVVGERPAVRFEVHVAGVRTLYPRGDKPAPEPGMDHVPVRLGRRKSVWGEGNRPHSSFDELIRMAKPDERGLSVQGVIKDDRAAVNFISGREKDLAPLNPKDKGHYHPQCSEFWLIMAGQMRYAIEGQGVIIASEGDVVYVPPFTYHAPRFHGEAPAVRLSMNGFYSIAHLYEDSRAH